MRAKIDPKQLAEAVAMFDDDGLVRMLLTQFADSFPDFRDGGPRVMAAAERAREIIRGAWARRNHGVN